LAVGGSRVPATKIEEFASDSMLLPLRKKRRGG
jgi:hypothetical protein